MIYFHFMKKERQGKGRQTLIISSKSRLVSL